MSQIEKIKKWSTYKFRWRYWKWVLMRQTPRQKTMKGGWVHRILGDGLFDPRLWKPTRYTLSLGSALGVFAGMFPIPNSLGQKLFEFGVLEEYVTKWHLFYIEQ